jgi:hypothetical protein
MNIVELAADPDEQMAAPCKWGNIVVGHACYCHNDSPLMPRKCPVWRSGDEAGWKRAEWGPIVQHTVTHYGKNDPRNTYEMRPEWPDAGCPEFEAS